MTIPSGRDPEEALPGLLPLPRPLIRAELIDQPGRPIAAWSPRGEAAIGRPIQRALAAAAPVLAPLVRSVIGVGLGQIVPSSGPGLAGGPVEVGTSLARTHRGGTPTLGSGDAPPLVFSPQFVWLTRRRQTPPPDRPTGWRSPPAPAAIAQVVEQDPSVPLASVQAAMEPRPAMPALPGIGTPGGSAVRIHTGPAAAATASALGAAAFTVGRDIFFGAGRFAPATPAGRALLAHELTHVRQQEQAPAVARPAPAGDRPETEAEAEAAERAVWLADRATAGRSVTVGTHHRHYATSNGSPVRPQDQARLDALSAAALAVCQQRLGTALGDAPPGGIGPVQVAIRLDLARLSDAQAAAVWGEALAAAIRRHLSGS